MDMKESILMSDTPTTDERIARMLDILERILPIVEKLIRHPMLARFLK